MTPILDSVLETYLHSLVPERDEVLREMEAEAARRRIPIIGPLVGHFLAQLALIHGSKRIFELGSAIGYSTIWWARAAGPNGRVIYTDSDEANARQAEGYFRRAGVLDRVQIEVGDALEILARQREPFDVVFNDVDKRDYPRVFAMASRHVRRGGIFVTDNALWSGRVAQPAAGHDESTRAIAQCNQLQAADKDWMTTIVPLRDGVSVSLKL